MSGRNLDAIAQAVLTLIDKGTERWPFRNSRREFIYLRENLIVPNVWREISQSLRYPSWEEEVQVIRSWKVTDSSLHGFTISRKRACKRE